MMNKLLIVISLILLSQTGCERVLVDKDPPNAAVENFDLLWRTVDEKYSFFAYKNIDWDSVYQAFRPRVYEGMPEQALFDLMDEMLYILHDGHVNLSAPFDVSRNWSWYLDYPENFNFSLLERNYLLNDYEITGPFINKKIGNVGYIYYGSFMSGFSDGQMKYLVEKFKDCRGIIIDIRGNGGGSIALIPQLTSYFVQEEQLTGYVRYKNGPAHEDFTTWYPQLVEPAGEVFQQPVVVLTNRSVYSAANSFASYMASLPQVTLMGDRTGGGGGAPFSGELMNGWRFRFSTTQMAGINKEQIENGVPVDIQQNLLPTDEAKGIDSILERALLYLN
jgi:hypothetical protein